ncbi:MAG: aminopeptidase [Candidatus Omnitrophota bacterium]|nr:aminopeptidase [Candidatus Omnitrophota bacterium]
MVDSKALEAVYKRSLKLRCGESCLIVTDTMKEEIGRAFHEYARGITARADIAVMAPRNEHAEEPPKEIAEVMLHYDVEILITHRSLTHTRARREATLKGARIATMPSVTEDMINRCMDIDYDKLRERSLKLCGLLEKASVVRVVTEKGTDISFGVSSGSFFGREGGCFDSPGAFGNLPEGEVAFAPETCEGTYVVDASFPDIGILDSPITFKTEKGRVISILGYRSEEIMERLEAAGEKAYHVAELGIGLNPKAKITGNILEDEKVIGTVHVAVGNDLSFGGTNDVALHLDGVIRAPDIYLDGAVLMKKGVFRENGLKSS